MLPGPHPAQSPPSTHVSGCQEKPLLCCLCICDGLLGSEGLQRKEQSTSPQLTVREASGQGLAAEAMWVSSCHKEQYMWLSDSYFT